MTTLLRTRDLLREIDERLATGSDDDLVALAGELEERLANLGDGEGDGDERVRLVWRAERLAFVLRALDL